MKSHYFLKIAIAMLFCVPNINANVTKTIGATGADFTTLKLAFDAINSNAGGIYTGIITLQVIDNTTETTTATLNSSTNWTSLNIYPTVSRKSICSNISSALILLNGADNVIIDGRLHSTAGDVIGTNCDLTITNMGGTNLTTAATIKFDAGAINNFVGYCEIKGSSTSLNQATIYFGSNGNSNNTICNNLITNADNAKRPQISILSTGTTTSNNNNQIKDNKFENCLSGIGNSYVINLGTLNSNWIISGNSFYETTKLIPTAGNSYTFISITNSTTGHKISDNFIGGTSAQCGGSALTKSNTASNIFTAISLSVGTGSATIVQNNVIQNFDWRNLTSAEWSAMSLSGYINVENNLIGSDNGTGSINISNGVDNGSVFGIKVTNYSTKPEVLIGNQIGSITSVNRGVSILCIYSEGTGNISVKNNIIGSKNSLNSINASAQINSQILYGIRIKSSGLNEIIGNTITNFSNGSPSAGQVHGIYIQGGTNTVDGNFISKISYPNSSASSSNTMVGLNIIGSTIGSTSTYSNNIISLGESNQCEKIYGIWEQNSSASSTSNIYFNTVYINGYVSGNSNNSYCLHTALATTVNKNIKNNILTSTRSSVNGVSLHYSLYAGASTGSYSFDYNNYFVSGTGSVLGNYGGQNMNALPIVTNQDINSKNFDPKFFDPDNTSIQAHNYLTSSDNDLNGINVGVATDFNEKNRYIQRMGAFENAITIKTVGNGGNFTTLKSAFDAINSNTGGIYKDTITLQIISNTSEPQATALLDNSNSNWTSLNIYPTTRNVTIDCNFGGDFIKFSGVKNVRIDGRLHTTKGDIVDNSRELTILNSGGSNLSVASTILFTNNSSNNTIKYCNLKGAGTATNRGTISFTTSSGVNGNVNNTIDNNKISGIATNRPTYSIYSQGSTGYPNGWGYITNNEFADFLSYNQNSSAIYSGLESKSWTISANSFYETTDFISTANVNYNIIYINNISGTTFTICDNFIGGKSARCGGNSWTKTGSNCGFTGIALNTSAEITNNIDNNAIRNISWTNTGNAVWTGISIIGVSAANIGTTRGNCIGDSLINESINYSSGATTGSLYGIKNSSSSVVNCCNNYIGSIKSSGSFSSNIYGIYDSGSGETNILNNIIGNKSISNSINNNVVASNQMVYGIYSLNTGTTFIKSNTIQNLTNSGNGYSHIYGIKLLNGKKTVNYNYINSLAIPNSSSGTPGNIYGIYFDASAPSVTSTCANNIISLSATNIPCVINGIYETNTTSSATSNLYFNTIYIGGNQNVGSTTRSYCIRCNNTTNNTRNIKNNILVSDRATPNAYSLHYAFLTTAAVNLNLDYNNYWVSAGNGSKLGKYNTDDKDTLPIIINNDTFSKNVDPLFLNTGGTTAESYTTSSIVDLTGISISDIIDDFFGCSRLNNQRMGALVLTSNSNGVKYYFSESGDDQLNNGTIDKPWKTITKANSILSLIQPGGTLFFKRGDTFYGSLNINQSGTSGNPIRISAYDNGSNPIITGFTKITSGWTSLGNGVYWINLESDSLTNMVTVDGKQVGMGRYPESGYLTYESATTNSITDNGLGSSTNWTGAELAIRKNYWTLGRCKILSHVGDVLTFKNLGSNDVPTTGFGYFIMNDLRTLTTFGEWYHDPINRKFYIYFGSIDPNTKIVKIATVYNLVENRHGKHYIDLDNIELTGAINDGYLKSTTSNYCNVKDCSISFCGNDGIDLGSGNGCIVDNNNIENCNSTGLFTNSSTFSVIKNNTVSNIGLIPGQSFSYRGINGIFVQGNDADVSNNIIKRCGYNGIILKYSGAANISYNRIDSVCMVLDDGGGIYTTSVDSKKRHIHHNIISNVIGNSLGTPSINKLSEGIYLDEYSSKVWVTENTIFNCGANGIKLHRAHDDTIRNNTVYNCKNSIIFLNELNPLNSSIQNILMKGNHFCAKDTDQTILNFDYDYNTISAFGVADSNIYARAINENNIIKINQPSEQLKSLSEWRAVCNQDLNSKNSPQLITDAINVRLEYNDTKNSKSISFDDNYISLDSILYSGSIVLEPFSSKLLLKFNGSLFRVKSTLTDITCEGIKKCNVKVYPNPIVNQINLKIENCFQDRNFEIVNSTGCVYLKGRIIGNAVVNASNLVPGIYFIKIEEVPEVIKIVKL